MFTKTKRIYEVWAYTNAQDGEPYNRETYTRKADALKLARAWASKYGRVEVNALYGSAYDDNDVQGDELITAYENGVRTTGTKG